MAESNRISASQWLVAALSLSLLVFLFGVAANAQLQVFEFRFNAYSLLSLLAVVSNLTAFVMVSRIKVKTDDLMWFSVHLFCLALWAGSEVLWRSSANPEASIFWSALGSLGAFVMPAAFYLFVLSYTHPRQARHPLTIVPLLLTPLFLLFFDFRTTFFNVYSAEAVAPKPWGLLVTAGPYYGLIIAWIVVLYGVSVGVLYRFYRRTLDPTLRAQAKWFMVATIVPVGLSIITDGVLPTLGVTAVLPMAVMFTSIMGMIITYGIVKHRFFTFNPQLVAANVLDTMNEAVVSIDVDFRIDYANKGAERLLGYSHDEFFKLRFGDFLTQKWNIGVLKKALVRPLDHSYFTQFDSVDLMTAHATTVTAKLSISKIVDDGVLRGYLVVMTDISKIARATEIIEQTVEARTRQVHAAEATLSTSINSLKMGFVIFDEVPEVLRVNTVAHELLCPNFRHHPAGECHELTLVEIQERFGETMTINRSLKNCMQRQLPHEIKNIEFTHRDWRVYFSPMVVDRQSIGCVMLLQDTTEERMLERSRDEFFSIASHELRTPLTSIKGNSAMIMQYYAEILKDRPLREMVEDIHESSDRLIEIVNDFLDVSRLEQNRIVFHPERLAVAKVIEDVAYGTASLIKQKGLHLQLSGSIRRLDFLPDVVADKNRLKQILFNLIGNATKFTEKGKIRIDAEVVGKYIKVSVTDTGNGIALDEQSLLFHKFQQASNNILTRDVSRGTGLGLYISRLLAAGMGGELMLERSAPGKGSTFSLTLPVATATRLKHLDAELAAAEAAKALNN